MCVRVENIYMIKMYIVNVFTTAIINVKMTNMIHLDIWQHEDAI